MKRSFAAAGRLRGSLRPPPDKSISHRAALIGAMGDAVVIENYLNAADTRATLAAVRELGGQVDAKPSRSAEGHPLGQMVTIAGPGLHGAAAAKVDVGNAGTLLRLLPGWLVGQKEGAWTVDGDASIRKRPVDRVAEPLRRMGARVECRDNRLPPIHIEATALTGIEYELPVASAQVKSCLLLAGLLAEGETTVLEPSPTRDHTERMLRAAGADLRSGGGRVSVKPAERLGAERIGIPGDLSSAAFPIVAALLVPGSEVEIEGVGLNPTRAGFVTILQRMGAGLEVQEAAAVGGEPQGTIRARASKLSGTRVDGDEVALAIDELPLVALAACFAEGETVIAEAGELRHKESDRIAAVCEGLAALGGDVEPTGDGIVIQGSGGLRGGGLDAVGDHRMAMLGAVAGVASREGVEVRGFEAVEVSYPGFERDLASLVAG
jgi:3-phosphoshikimate 1-carboxyvinyltransferase